jgi:hypothetical protein
MIGSKFHLKLLVESVAFKSHLKFIGSLPNLLTLEKHHKSRILTSILITFYPE